MVRPNNRIMLLTGVYVIALTVLAYVVLAAATNAHVVWGLESELGHSLSCNEAYFNRSIGAYFYPDKVSQGNALYLYSICAPIILLGLAGLMGAVGLTVRRGVISARFKRMLYGLMAIGAAMLIALLIYSPVIYLIGCALE